MSPTETTEERALAFFTTRHHSLATEATALREKGARTLAEKGAAALMGDMRRLLRIECEAEVWRVLVMLCDPDRRLSAQNILNRWLTGPGGSASTDPFDNLTAQYQSQAVTYILSTSAPALIPDEDLRGILAYMNSEPYGS